MSPGDQHFEHGDSFKCLLCFANEASVAGLERSRRAIKEESANSVVQGGLELKLLMDKRELEEPEALLLLFAGAYTSESTAETTHVYYHLLCSEFLDERKFKRFRVNNSNKALRRRLALLRKKYGADCTDSESRVLNEVSKHPVHVLSKRAGSILETIRKVNSEEVEGLNFLPSSVVADPIEAKIVVKAKSNKKRLRKIFSRRERNDNAVTTRSSALTMVRMASNLDDFYAHFLQLYDDSQVDLEALYVHAFQSWIPQLSRGQSRELSPKCRRHLLNMLQSLLFISLREKRRFEALRLVHVLLQNTTTQHRNHWRLLVFKQYLSEEMDEKVFGNDLYVKFVDNLSFDDKHMYACLKFDVLVKHSRFVQALELTENIAMPFFKRSLAVWIKTTTCRLKILLVYMKETEIRQVVGDQLHKLRGEKENDKKSGSRLSELVQELVSEVSKRLPVHLPWLQSTFALLVTCTCAFEGQKAAALARKGLEQAKMTVSPETYANSLRVCALMAHDAGNLKLAQCLIAAMLREYGMEAFCWEIRSCLGLLEVSRDNAVKAADHLREAVIMAEQEKGRSASFGFCILFYAYSLQLQGKFHSAERLYKLAFDLFKSGRNLSMCARSLFALATLMWKCHAWDAAIVFLNKAERLIPYLAGREVGNPVTSIYGALAASHSQLGDKILADYYFKKLALHSIDVRIAEGTATVELYRTVKSWDEWLNAVSLAGSLDHLDGITRCLLPFPSTGEQNMVLEDKHSATLFKTWNLHTLAKV